MEAIDRRPRTGALLPFHRRAEQPVGERPVAEIPGPEKIVFGSRPDDGRRRFAVDEEHVVTLAPPEILVLEHRHRHSRAVAAPGRLHPHVVVLPAAVRLLVAVRLAVTLPV